MTTPVILVLLLTGFVLLFLEIITPSFGVLAAMAVGSLCVVVWQCYVRSTLMGSLAVLGLLVLIPVYLTVIVKFLPKTPLAGRLFLKSVPSAEADAVPDANSLDAMVGQTAVAATQLRPAGMVRIDGHRISALAEGEMIEEGQTVSIIRISGSDVIVRLATHTED